MYVGMGISMNKDDDSRKILNCNFEAYENILNSIINFFSFLKDDNSLIFLKLFHLSFFLYHLSNFLID